MIPQKYDFYLGVSVGPSRYYFYNNAYYNTSTGEMVYDPSCNSVASELCKVSERSIGLYLSKFSDKMLIILFFDKNKKYIGATGVQKGGLKYPLPKDSGIPSERRAKVSYFAMSFNADSSELYRAIHNRELFIYELYGIMPHYKELKKKYAKEQNQEFLRATLDGTIKLTDNDFDVLYRANIEDKYLFFIDKHSTTSFLKNIIYEGYFYKSDCKFDADKRIGQIKVSPHDKYTEILNKYEETYDIIKLAPAITKIKAYKRTAIQIYISGSNSFSTFYGGTYYEAEVSEVVESNDALVNKYHFNLASTKYEVEANITGYQTSFIGVFIKSNATEYFEMQSNYRMIRKKVYSKGDFIEDTGEIGSTVPDMRSNNNLDYIDYVEQLDTYYPIYSRNIYKLQIIDKNGVILSQSTGYFGDSNESSDFVYARAKEVTFKPVNDSRVQVVLTGNTFVYKMYERMLTDLESINGKNTYELSNSDFATPRGTFKRCIGSDVGTIIQTAETSEEPTKFGLTDYGTYFTDKFLPTTLGISRPIPILKSTWVNSSLWYIFPTEYELVDNKSRKEFYIKDAYMLSDIIKVMLKKIDPSITHEATAEYSQFLYADNNPLVNQRFYISLAPKSNILKGDYDQPAKKAELTFKDLMDMLSSCFRCYWFIEDNKFKIEHIYYFMNGRSYTNNENIQLDFTKIVDRYNKKPALYGQAEIEFDKTNLTSRYEFAWMDDSTDLFGNMTADIKSNYIQKDKTEEVNASQFSSDIDYMLFNPSNFSSDGFALLCPIKNSETSQYELPIITVENLQDENNNKYRAIIQNYYASWLYLIQLYLYDAPAETVVCNNIADTLYATKIKKCMSQDIKFVSEKEPDMLKCIKTNIGTGVIDEMSINIDTNLINITLLHEPK